MLFFSVQMVLETLGWGREPREDVSFVLEARLHFTQPTDVNWRNLFSVKMAPVSAILVTLGQNTLTPTLKFERYVGNGLDSLQLCVFQFQFQRRRQGFAPLEVISLMRRTVSIICLIL